MGIVAHAAPKMDVSLRGSAGLSVGCVACVACVACVEVLTTKNTFVSDARTPHRSLGSILTARRCQGGLSIRGSPPVPVVHPRMHVHKGPPQDKDANIPPIVSRSSPHTRVPFAVSYLSCVYRLAYPVPPRPGCVPRLVSFRFVPFRVGDIKLSSRATILPDTVNADGNRWFARIMRELVECPVPDGPDGDAEFATFLSSLLKDHTCVPQALSRGVLELQEK